MSRTWEEMKQDRRSRSIVPPTIPEIEDEELDRLVRAFPPVVKTPEGFRRIELPDLRRTAYTWSPTPVDSPLVGLEVARTFHAYHGWSFHGFFKPSVAELLACFARSLPDELSTPGYLWLDTDSVQEPDHGLLSRPDHGNLDGYHRSIVVLLRERTDPGHG